MTTRAEEMYPHTMTRRPGARIVMLASGAFLLVLAWLCASHLHVGATQGTVGIVENIDAPREAWRIVPAENADVLILWRARGMFEEHPSTRCVRAVLTRTNASGEYSVASWWLPPSWPPRFDARGDVYVFSPGRLPIVDRSGLAPTPAYTHILGPPAINPWTGLVLPDESSLRPMHDSGCPAVERGAAPF